MNDAQLLLQKIQLQKEANLQFFEKYLPDIAISFRNRELVNLKLNIDPRDLSIEVLKDNESYYKKKATDYCREEAAIFSKGFKPGKPFKNMRHHYVGEFLYPRFFHQSINNYLKDLGDICTEAQPYVFRETIPQVIFLGCGLGYHIKELLSIRPVNHVVLVEHDPDFFLASLYTTNWKSIIMPYIEDKTRSFSYSIGDTIHLANADRVHDAFAGAWNAANTNVPFFPIQTAIYNHNAEPFHAKVIDRIQSEIESFANTWGYYDDEVNQLNHVMHNMANRVPVLHKVDFSLHEKPVLICGNGPSLDNYLALIKEYREKLTIISAGSTTDTLFKNDIIPDFVVTVESDLQTYEAFTWLDKQKAKQTTLIGAAQIHPKTFKIFSKGLMYLKKETATSQVFLTSDEQLEDGVPSATNAALAFATELNFKNIFLVGTDYGYILGQKHHASDSFYYINDSSEKFVNYEKSIQKDSYFLEENQFGKIYTTQFYNTSRLHAQKKIRKYSNVNFTNLSVGATIIGAPFGTADNLISALPQSFNNEVSIVDELYSKAIKPSTEELNKAIGNIENYLKQTSEEIINLVKTIEANMDSIEVSLFKINEVLVGPKSRPKGSLPMFIRGTIWYWLLNYYALITETNGEQNIEKASLIWKKHFVHFLKMLPEHFKAFLFYGKDNEDPKLSLSVADKEPELEKWLKIEK